MPKTQEKYCLDPGGPAPNMQLLYEAVLCIWQLTFLQEAAEAIASTAVVPNLVEVAKSAQKEKVHPPAMTHHAHLCRVAATRSTISFPDTLNLLQRN
jgi:hypothetical protein